MCVCVWGGVLVFPVYFYSVLVFLVLVIDLFVFLFLLYEDLLKWQGPAKVLNKNMYWQLLT